MVRSCRTNQNKRTKFRDCKNFADTGSCSYADTCKYAHVLGAKPGEDVTEKLAAMEKEKAQAPATEAAAAQPAAAAAQQ